MNNTPPQISPTARFASNSIMKFVKLGALAFFGFNTIIFLLLGAVFTVSSYGTLAYSGSTEGEVRLVTRQEPNEDGTVYCTFSYSYSVNGKSYLGKSEISTPDSCSLENSGTIPVQFDTSQPFNSSADSKLSAITGIIMLALGGLMLLGIIIGLVINAQIAKRADSNFDGQDNDNMPATDAQLNIIQNGMKELGEFWMPHKMTQNEARETIESIAKKLSDRNK